MTPASVVGVAAFRRFWPPRELTEGEAPDARFTLANERTFLAWIRTSLGLIAAAVGLEAFAPEVVPEAVRTPLVVVLLVLAALLAGYAFRRWLRVEGAIRTGRAPGGSPATVV
ncbi:YidH family protein, partial [Tsukamurella strandjordii]